MTVAQGSIADLVSNDFSKIFVPELAKFKPIYSTIFNILGSTGKYEKISGVSSIGLIPEKAESTEMTDLDPEQLYDKTFTHSTKAASIRITKEAYDDDKSGALKSAPKMLAKSMYKTIETDAANIFNRAFNSSYTGADSKVLCATDHPLAPSLTASSYANTPSTAAAISEAALEESLIRMANMKDDKGVYGEQIIPKFLMVSANDMMKAKKLLLTQTHPYSAELTRNVVGQDYNLQLIVNPFLDSGKWFLIGDKPDTQLIFYWREKPNDGADNDTKTSDAIYYTRARFSLGWVSARGVDGSYSS